MKEIIAVCLLGLLALAARRASPQYWTEQLAEEARIIQIHNRRMYEIHGKKPEEPKPFEDFGK